MCSDCGRALGGRWGNRCYWCNGRPKTGGMRQCKICAKEFYVPAWKPRDRNQGTYCSRDCKYEDMLRTPGTRGESLNERRKRSNRQKYGLRPGEYEAMLDSQDGKCAICLEPPTGGATSQSRLHIDHDHKRGWVRGLLCSRCNTALGLLRDRPDLVRAAAEYLDLHQLVSRIIVGPAPSNGDYSTYLEANSP